MKSKYRQPGSSPPVCRTSQAPEASEASQPQEQQHGQPQRPPASRSRAQGIYFSPSELKAAFATGSSHPDASIPQTQMLAYTYADEATQARMRDASPLLRHAIAYRSVSGQERRRMQEDLPTVIEEEKKARSGYGEVRVAVHRPYTSPKCPTKGVKVTGRVLGMVSCHDRRCHCNIECTGEEECVLCATYLPGRAGGGYGAKIC